MNLRYMTNAYCRLILILIALFALSACGQGGGGSGQTENSIVSVSDRDSDSRCDEDDDDEDCRDGDGDGGSTDGASLYAQYCSACHDSLSNSEVRGASADDIEDAIDDEDKMEFLEFLKGYQIEAIADALSGTGGGGGGGGSSAVNIIAVHNPSSPQYDDNCLNCHGDIPNAQSLNPAIPDAHVAMLPFTPGEDSDRCIWCHRDVSSTLIHTAAQVGAFQTDIRKTVDTQLCGICHGPVGPGKPFYQSGLTTTADPDGSVLYGYLCSACHRDLANSEVKGDSATAIYDAIAGNKGGMAPLSVLNPTWVQAITVALGGDPTLPPNIPSPGTGASLYQQYCSSCHGALASSTKTGATAAQIQNGINNVNEMTSLNFLTATQVQDIADALSTGGGGGGGTDGAALYDQYCATCHNSLANSDQSGASAALIQNGINNVTEMNSLSFLTSTQVQAISDALSGGGGGGGLPASHTDDKGGALHMPGKDTPYSSGCTACHGTTLQGDIGPSCFSCHDQKWNEDPPSGGGTGGTDGAALYDQYCATCHNSLANSDQSGASAGLIQNGIDNVSDMSSLSFLTSTQVQAISDALAGGGTGGGGTGGTDGAALYDQYCATCHNTLANSDQSGASAGLIQNGIDNVSDMSSLSFLTSTQVQAISDALSGGGGGGGGGGGLPASHTDDKGGALHMPGKDTPYSSGCTACHGTTLQGDIGPSCFSCHDQKWNENPPSGDGGGGTDGESLYNQYCSSCHRSLKDSEVRGDDEEDIEDAIDDEDEMEFLEFLRSDQIEAIADALDGDS